MVEDGQRPTEPAGPAAVAALRAEADRLLRAGAIEPAIAAHERLLAARPDLADSWFNLGWLRRQRRRFQPSLDAYAEAIARGMRGAEEARLNRAVILSEHLERPRDAEAELEKALAANPRFTLAWLNLGNLREDHGDGDGARAAYARVLALEPGNGRAHARLAAIDTFEGGADIAIASLKPLADRLQGEDQAEVLFALGNALDAAGRYDDAFATFGQANALGRALLPPTARYDRARAGAQIDALIAAFPAAAPPRSQASGPIFICGLFRSGSTLAEQILARHSAVTPGGEMETLPALVAERLQPYPEAVRTADPAALAEAYLEEARALHPAARVLTDKRCDNFLHIGLIKTMFPAARIVHTRREPLDTLLSTWFLYFGEGVGYGFDLSDAAHWLKQYQRLMAHWRGLYGVDIHDLDYEAVVGEPRPTIERLLAFCGLDWEAACLSDTRATRPIRTASVWQVRQPLHRRSAGRWRHYDRHLDAIMAELSRP